MDEKIFQPFFALILLTFAVWVFMYIRRTSFLVGERVDLRKVDTPVKMDRVVPGDVNLPAYALRNLFEVPAIFYALCLYLYVTSSVDRFYIAAAWVFVIGRALHAVIYCSSNKVMHRFVVYFSSAIVLWAMVIRAAADVFLGPAT